MINIARAFCLLLLLGSTIVSAEKTIPVFNAGDTVPVTLNNVTHVATYHGGVPLNTTQFQNCKHWFTTSQSASAIAGFPDICLNEQLALVHMATNAGIVSDLTQVHFEFGEATKVVSVNPDTVLPDK
jgi:hypothetical protein